VLEPVMKTASRERQAPFSDRYLIENAEAASAQGSDQPMPAATKGDQERDE
jgi:hypothetical protein